MLKYQSLYDSHLKSEEIVDFSLSIKSMRKLPSLPHQYMSVFTQKSLAYQKVQGESTEVTNKVHE